MSEQDVENVEQWVLDYVEENTEPDPKSKQLANGTLWTSKKRVKKHGGKFSTPVTEDAAEQAVYRLAERGELLYWHGIITLAADEYLQAVIGSEENSDAPRQILVGRVNRMLQADDPAEVQEVDHGK